IVKKNLYDNNMSFRLDVSRTSSALAFTWRVGVINTTDSRFSVTYTLGPYSIATGVGDWHHVVATYKSGTGLRLYVDGVLVSSLLGPTYVGNVFNSDGPFEIAFGSGSDFIGLVDEVRLYPNEISPSMINQRYLDTKNGLSNNSTISKYDTNINDQWRCQITPNDRLIDGATVNTATRTIVDATNTPPSASNLVITPASPLTGDDLVASYSYSDPEGNLEVGSIVNWYNGTVFVFSNPILPASLTTKGNVWSFRVTPSDSFEYGAEVISGTVTIGNTAPSFTGGVILPNPALDSSTLTASPSGWTDADNDAPGYTYQWQIKTGGVYTDIPGMTTQTLSTASFGPNDWIAVKVTAFDGALYNNTLTFETTIVDSDPPTTGTPSLVSSSGSNRDDDELMSSPVNTQDPDGDSVTNIFNWLTGSGSSTSITNLYLPFETNSSASATDYSSYGNNGALTGAIWTSNGIVGGAYNFDGNDYITLADNASLGNDGTWNELTVEYWVYPSVNQRGGRILNKNGGSASTSGKYMTGFNSGSSNPYNTVFFGVTTAESEYEEPTYKDTSNVNTTAIPTGSWTYVVGTYEAGFGLKLYINGVLASELNGIAGSITASIGEPLIVGYSSPIPGSSSRYFKGSLDEIRIYPTVLSAAQIFQNYIDQKDGLSDHVTIVPEETSSGQTWSCQVTPNDGWQDGQLKLSNQLTITSTNTKPHIDWYSPANSTVLVKSGQNITFQQISSDPDNSPLTYQWTLDTVNQATTQNWSSTNLSVGTHTVRVTVSDGTSSDYQEWTTSPYTPPVTSDNYDGAWHKADFTITLTATDNEPGTIATYYKVNNGLTGSVSFNGQPNITVESANNTLEYWSVDNLGNEELPHKILVGIKLDKTNPAGSVQIKNGAIGQNQTFYREESVAFNATGSIDNMDIASYSWDFGDASQASGITTTHSYFTAGTYTARLTVQDQAGNTATSEVTLTVLPEVPEFNSTTIIVTLLMTTGAIIILIRRRLIQLPLNQIK
ncbi:MAG: hypothetical protein QG670_433, partial [Thermoproteota archaeon]|nr:hypothetical protein [Thermoproteota archaeon]